MLDNALSCKAFRELYQERDSKFRERFHSLPRSEMSPINVQLSTPSALQKSTVCYFTGIPASVMSDPAAWVVVPASLLREQDARRLQGSSSSSSSSSATKDSAENGEGAYSLRARRHENSHSEEVIGTLALKYAVIQPLQCFNTAEKEFEGYEVCVYIFISAVFYIYSFFL